MSQAHLNATILGAVLEITGENSISYVFLQVQRSRSLAPPIAFVDDFLISAIRQNQVKVLAKYHQVTLSAEEMRLLTSVDSEGCWQGLLGVLKYPFKIIRQFIKVLEVKKSVDRKSVV